MRSGLPLIVFAVFCIINYALLHPDYPCSVAAIDDIVGNNHMFPNLRCRTECGSEVGAWDLVSIKSYIKYAINHFEDKMRFYCEVRHHDSFLT